MPFNHSVKVPRKYKLSATILKQVEKGGSLKALVYQDKYKKHWPVDAIYALTAETLKHDAFLNRLLLELNFVENEPRLDPWLAKVLMVELLFGNKELIPGSKPIDAVLSYREKATQSLNSLNIDVADNKKPASKPRYVRVNTLKVAIADAIRYYQNSGWRFIRCTSGSYDDYLNQIKNLTESDFLQDYHVKTVFAFAPGAKLKNDEYFAETNILLQDKATCLASVLLAPTPGSVTIDLCAAPGLKTTHLAALIKNEGTIYAVERNEERFEVLCKFVEETGATCVEPINKDAFQINKDICPNVEYVLVDPSCSGSGMDRPEATENTYSAKRLKKLSSMQAKLLRHALFAFPNAKRVVYSTCSLHPEENEQVVSELANHPKSKFQLISAKSLLNDKWNNTGDLVYKDVGEKCLYAIPTSDLTTGFFIAVFERVKEDEVISHVTSEIGNADEALSDPKMKKKPKLDEHFEAADDVTVALSEHEVEAINDKPTNTIDEGCIIIDIENPEVAIESKQKKSKKHKKRYSKNESHSPDLGNDITVLSEDEVEDINVKAANTIGEDCIIMDTENPEVAIETKRKSKKHKKRYLENESHPPDLIFTADIDNQMKQSKKHDSESCFGTEIENGEVKRKKSKKHKKRDLEVESISTDLSLTADVDHPKKKSKKHHNESCFEAENENDEVKRKKSKKHKKGDSEDKSISADLSSIVEEDYHKKESEKRDNVSCFEAANENDEVKRKKSKKHKKRDSEDISILEDLTSIVDEDHKNKSKKHDSESCFEAENENDEMKQKKLKKRKKGDSEVHYISADLSSVVDEDHHKKKSKNDNENSYEAENKNDKVKRNKSNKHNRANLEDESPPTDVTFAVDVVSEKKKSKKRKNDSSVTEEIENIVV